MNSCFLLLVLAIPSAVLYFRFPGHKDIIIEGIVTLALIFLGWKAFRLKGCLKTVGIVLLVVGIFCYYFLVIQPLMNGKIILLNFL
jgi:hypothetical protein